MKRWKKLFALMAAMIMVIAMAVPVSVGAAGTNSVTITANDTAEHTYNAYQIFSGTLSSDGKTLSDIQWGSGVDTSSSIGGYTLIEALKNDSTIGTDMASVTTAADVVAVLETYSNGSDKLEAFAAVVALYLDSAAGSGTGTGTVTIDGLDAGYYLITDTVVSGSGATSSAILQVLGNVTMTSKSDLPTVTKTAGTETASIGDTITYTITGELSSTFPGSYSPYVYTLTDTMASCLDLVYTYPSGDASQVTGGVTVMMGSTDVTSYFTITYDTTDHILTLACADLTQIPNIDADSVFTITYDATVNSSLSGGDIENTVQLVTSEATTPEIEETVYSFALSIDKVDGETGNAITTGATFVLKNAAGEYLQVDANNKVSGWTTDSASASALTTDANGNIVVYGLAEGTYYLEETVAPEGYNALSADLTIVIAATVDSSTGELETYTISVDGGTALSGTESSGNYVLSMEVENNAGATMPTTGGIGTTIFYVAGAVLVIGAAVLLITKRRMRAEE